LQDAIADAIIQNGGVYMSFDKIIRSIRKEMELSQEQLARELNVSFSTLNRWENGKTSPSKLAKEKIVNYCVEHGIDQSKIDMIK
jgi:transcriptional regulator with XRE-family HTH domain